jgi:hypothetical protein
MAKFGKSGGIIASGISLLLLLISFYFFFYNHFVLTGILIIAAGILAAFSNFPYIAILILFGLAIMLFPYKENVVVMVTICMLALFMVVMANFNLISLFRLKRNGKLYDKSKEGKLLIFEYLKDDEITHRVWNRLKQKFASDQKE